MKQLWLCPVLLMIWLSWTASAEEGSVPLVPSIPPMFQAEIQVTVIHANSTYHAQVYYKSDTKEGAVVIDQPNKRMQLIYNFNGKTKETLFIDDKHKCTALEDGHIFVFSPQETFSPGYLIGLADEMAFRVKGAEALGITADMFIAEDLAYPFMNASDVDIESFWSNEEGGWNFPHCPSPDCEKWRIPLRTIVSAKVNDIVRNVDYVYYNYRETDVDLTAFEIPDGVYCDGIKSTKDLPAIEFDFSTGIEVSSTDNPGGTTTTELHYSSQMEVTRKDEYISAQDGSGIFQTEINDYIRGARYRINRETEECLERKLLRSIEEKPDLHNVYDFLASDKLNIKDAFYVGTRKVRGIECDLWVLGRSEPSMMTVDQICLKKIDKRLPDGTGTTIWIPIFINQINFDANGVTTEQDIKHYYNFEDGPPNWNYFDVTPCVEEADRKRFQIELKGEHMKVKQNPSGFITAVRTTIKGLTQISLIRIQDILLDYTMNEGGEYVLFTATLLEDIKNIGDMEGNDLYEAISDQAAHNADVYLKIANAVFGGKFEVSYRISDNFPPMLYMGTSIRKDVTADPDKKTEIFKDAYIFKGDQDLTGKGYDYQLSDQSMSDCGAECYESDSLVCETFAFCKYTRSCKISHLHFDNITDGQKVSNTGCSLYARDYLLDYAASQFVKVKANEDEAGVEPESLSEEDCASKCSFNQDNSLPFRCEGFNLCVNSDDGKMTCEFRSRHILEVPPDTDIVKNNSCSYYSRDYFEDYVVHINQAVKDAPLVLTQLTSAEDCARICSTLPDERGCSGFEMCTSTEEPLKSTCKILEYKSGDSPVTLTANAECDHYTPQRYRKHLPPQPPKQKQSKKTGFSAGAMAGLGVGMVVLGFFLGGIAMVVYMRVRLRSMQASRFE